MSAVTVMDPETKDFKMVYKQKWAWFFYLVGCFAGVGVLAVVIAYFLRPGEWVNRENEKGKSKSCMNETIYYSNSSCAETDSDNTK